ncbi:MAG: hypothetical protein ACE5JL_03020, partial [Dehalococcoidia bacterium]
RYRWSRLRRRLFEGRYLDTELPQATSLEDIEASLKQIVWTGDGLWHLYDSISYPQTVWANKKDDCDGFAILASELLQRWTPAAEPVLVTAIVRPAQSSHTVCAFRHGEGLWFFDNHELRRGDFQEYGDVVAQFTRGAKSLICWDVVKPDTLETLEFHRA